MNSYLYRIPRLCNSLPLIDLCQTLQTIKFKLKNYFWNDFVNNFDSNKLCTFYFRCPGSKCLNIQAPTNYFILYLA